MTKSSIGIKNWFRRHHRAILVFFGVTIGLIIIAQCVYPSDRLLPYASIDSVAVGGWRKQDVTAKLDAQAANQPIEIIFGDNIQASFTPKPTDIGVVVGNQSRIESLSYPWYMRLVPGSWFWYGRMYQPTALTYERNDDTLKSYVDKTLGSSCDVKPVNAGLETGDGTIRVVPSKTGGTCDLADVFASLHDVKPSVTASSSVHIALDEIAPAVDDSKASALADVINDKLASGKITVTAGLKAVEIDSKKVASWLAFTTKDNDIITSLSTKKAAQFFNDKLAPAVSVSPGTTYVNTVDFQVVSQKTGSDGRSLDSSKTATAIVRYLVGTSDKAKAVTKIVSPRLVYARKYSKTDTGMSALFANYAKDHPGTYGVQLIELSGQRRRASYNANRQFVTASTYKLFVAYSTLRRIESGAWKWTDQVTAGKDMAKCFDDMIVQSDNACAEALEHKVGNVSLTNEAHAIGCTNTTFLDQNIHSTPADEALLLASLQSGQILNKQSSRDRLISAMKRNVYRQGIPAGSSGTVADKVGFLWNLLHDAAIVYSPKGTYVLVIMTDGSSWGHIADLTRQLEKLRA